VTLQGQNTVRQGDQGRQPISLVIPCRAEYVSLCRLVAGVVAARASLDEEAVADMKLVVTEACTCFLWGPDGGPLSAETARPDSTPAFLRLDFTVAPGSWEITISDPDSRHRVPKHRPSDPQAVAGGGLGLTIIAALVDSVEHTDTESEGTVMRLAKRVSTG
jgi:anti-sigma regulatory factor (Ser/Thr protein kinase)